MDFFQENLEFEEMYSNGLCRMGKWKVVLLWLQLPSFAVTWDVFLIITWGELLKCPCVSPINLPNLAGIGVVSN